MAKVHIRTHPRSGKSHRRSARAILGCGLLLASAAALAVPPKADGAAERVRDLGDFCLVPAGDLTGDRAMDYAVSHKPPAPKPRIAYILAEAELPLSPTVTEAQLRQSAVRTLQGPEAARFACGPRLGAGRANNRPAPKVARAAAATGTEPPRYSVQRLESPSDYIVAKGLNAAGTVVGEFLVGGESRAFRFDGTELRDLGTLGGHSSSAAGVNSGGETVGVSLTGEVDRMGFVNAAFLSDGITMRDLGLRWSWANAVNDDGQVVGGAFIDVSGERVHRAFLHDEEGTELLGTLGRPRYSEAHAVNGAGEVVGEADTFIDGTELPSSRAFVYRGGEMIDLGALGRLCYEEGPGSEECVEESVATDINDRGESAGFSTTDTAYAHAFVTADGELEDLGTLGGSQSWAYALNDSGQVVGTSLDADESTYLAFLYEQGMLYDLNALLELPPGAEPVQLSEASDINNFGQIVSSPYLLTPQYDEVTPGAGFSRRQALGRELRFEYWVAPEPGRECTGRKASVRLELRIDGVRADPRGRAARVLDRWLAVDRGIDPCAASSDWQRASVRLPKALRGEMATLAFRLEGEEHPRVYLRRFTAR